MPIGVYKKTKEHKQKLSEAIKGKKKPPFTKEHRRKIGEASKGRIPWNKGLTKEIDERVAKMAKDRIGRITSKITREKISKSNKRRVAWNKGKNLPPHSEKTKEKMSKAHKGCVIWNKGLTKKTDERVRKKAELQRGLQAGENHPMWGKHHSEEIRKKISERCPKGKEHRNWHGGITPLRTNIRFSFKYRQWRSDIFTRDDFTCQECNRRGRKLHAHHIISLADIIVLNDVQTLGEAMDCEELWNINNGVTFCKDCHKKFIK